LNHLDDERFSGNIPKALGRLEKLKVLSLGEYDNNVDMNSVTLESLHEYK